MFIRFHQRPVPSSQSRKVSRLVPVSDHLRDDKSCSPKVLERLGIAGRSSLFCVSVYSVFQKYLVRTLTMDSETDECNLIYLESVYYRGLTFPTTLYDRNRPIGEETLPKCGTNFLVVKNHLSICMEMVLT